jgi:hypothetical protein
MTLADYLTRHEISVEEFARQISVEPISVRRYLAGSRWPKWPIMERIVKATAGAVTPNDFAKTKEKKKPARRMRSPACAAA